MEKDAMLMKCGRCLQQVALGEMKYAKDGRTLVCQKCRGLSVKEHLEKIKGHASPETKTCYACTACGFSFSRGNITPKRCPYCAKESIVLQEKMSSAGLIDDA